MNKEEIKEFEKKIMWSWVKDELPKLFPDDEDDDIGMEATISVGSYKGTLSWCFEQEGGELLFVMDNDGAFYVTISEVCHPRKTIWLNVPENDVDVEEMKACIYVLCEIFIKGNWHDFNDKIGRFSDWRRALDEYMLSDEENFNVTYILL